ncbi:MAG: hypothetical protein A2289_11010 [Deltaproteobacteria bacterium RIFOXYA12_FULL_58_15]|nr:MAG: hypothetical protein A2289_11010 [Deltaproteobacteria bacterium RIFOXYA12_FULL_58_15]OGR12921.1 MAG: hypothetical protein A2341_09195 [Deltaproteobacteria bacterium RIFOXYB12_FULL_58_9]
MNPPPGFRRSSEQTASTATVLRIVLQDPRLLGRDDLQYIVEGDGLIDHLGVSMQSQSDVLDLGLSLDSFEDNR